MNTIASVSDSGLCTGCGTCAGLCPQGAIEMQKLMGLMLPEIQEEKCNQCGVCVQCCPGHLVDFEELNSEVFGRQPEDVLLGNYIGCYIGHANDRDVRFQSSSGGLVSELLIFALERGVIDGALIVRMNQDRPLEPESLIARTREEILSASKSKYCPVSMNEALGQVLKEDGKFAVVGLPCHIHGIRKAERVFRTLEKKIFLHVGLMCSHTVSFFGSEFLLEKMHIKDEQVVDLSYRGMGWPGSMSIRLKDGSNRSIRYVGGWNAYWPIFSSFFFTPMRCIMCPDETNELADISLGDAWLPELKREKCGESVIVTRTKTAEDILAFASAAGVISVRPIEPEKVKRSQAVPLKFKKDDLGIRLAILKSLDKEIPDFNPKPNSSRSFVAFLRAFFSYFNIQASLNTRLRSLLIYVPFPLFRLCYGVLKFLSSI